MKHWNICISQMKEWVPTSLYEIWNSVYFRLQKCAPIFAFKIWNFVYFTNENQNDHYTQLNIEFSIFYIWIPDEEYLTWKYAFCVHLTLQNQGTDFLRRHMNCIYFRYEMLSAAFAQETWNFQYFKYRNLTSDICIWNRESLHLMYKIWTLRFS